MIYLLIVIITVVILLLLAPKQAAKALASVAIAVVGIGGIIYWSDYKEQNEFEKVMVELSLDSSNCPIDRALQYQIINRTEERVYRVFFRFSVFRQGYSSPVSKSYSNEVTEDKIIEPGETFMNCTVMPELDHKVANNELTFKVDHKRVWFNQPIH